MELLKGTVPFFLPRTLVSGDQLNMTTLGNTMFGKLCEVHENLHPTNNTKLMQTGISFFLLLLSNRVVRHHQWERRPLPSSIIRVVECMTDRDGMADKIVFVDRHGNAIDNNDDADNASNAGSLAGMDYGDKFEYPSVPLDDKSDSNDETYCTSNNEDGESDKKLEWDNISDKDISILDGTPAPDDNNNGEADAAPTDKSRVIVPKVGVRPSRTMRRQTLAPHRGQECHPVRQKDPHTHNH